MVHASSLFYRALRDGGVKHHAVVENMNPRQRFSSSSSGLWLNYMFG